MFESNSSEILFVSEIHVCFLPQITLCTIWSAGDVALLKRIHNSAESYYVWTLKPALQLWSTGLLLILTQECWQIHLFPHLSHFLPRLLIFSRSYRWRPWLPGYFSKGCHCLLTDSHASIAPWPSEAVKQKPVVDCIAISEMQKVKHVCNAELMKSSIYSRSKGEN